MVGASAAAFSPGLTGLMSDIKTGIDFDSAQVHETPRVLAHISQPNRLPEADCDPDPDKRRHRHRTQADWRAVVLGIRVLAACNRERPDRQWKHAVPANIPNRIDEVAVAGIHRGRFSGPQARAKQGDVFLFHGRDALKLASNGLHNMEQSVETNNTPTETPESSQPQDTSNSNSEKNGSIRKVLQDLVRDLLLTFPELSEAIDPRLRVIYEGEESVRADKAVESLVEYRM